MFILLMILVTAVPGIDRTTALGTFDTKAECEERRAYVLEGMQQAYPSDDSYRIICKPLKEA